MKILLVGTELFHADRPSQETNLYKARRYKENFQRDSIEEDAQFLEIKNWKTEVLNRKQ
jgi:hypothetical protein